MSSLGRCMLLVVVALGASPVGAAAGELLREDFDGRAGTPHGALGAVRVEQWGRGKGVLAGSGGAVVFPSGDFTADAGYAVHLGLGSAPEGVALWLGFRGDDWEARSGVRVAFAEGSLVVGVKRAGRSRDDLPPAVAPPLPRTGAALTVRWVPGPAVEVALGETTVATFYVGDHEVPERGTIALEPLGGRVVLTRIAVRDLADEPLAKFEVRGALDVQDEPYFVTADDIDADGHDDLLVTNRGRLDGFTANTTVSVLYGRGDGTFEPARHEVVGKGPYTIETADVTGDGVRDLLVASFYEWAGRHLTVLSGAALNAASRGAAEAQSARAFYLDSRRSFATAAVRGLELDAAAGYEMSFDLVCKKGGSLYVWAALTGDSLEGRAGVLLRLAPRRTLLFTREHGADWREQSVAAERLIGPGDRIAVRVEKARHLRVLVNGELRAQFDCGSAFPKSGRRIPDGTIGLQVSSPRGEIGVDALRVTTLDGKTRLHEDDFDGADGPPARWTDLGGNARLLRRATLPGPARHRTVITLPATQPLVEKRSRWPLPGATSLVVRDFDGDGAKDIATVTWTSDTLHVLRGDGKGAFTPNASYQDEKVGHGLRDIRAADLDGDGKLDLAVTCYSSNHVAVFQGKGDATFRFRKRFESGGKTAYHLTVADLDGDGRPDIAVGNYSGEVKVLVNAGRFAFRDGGSYRRFGTSAAVQNEIRDVLAHDFDGDGVPDLLLACASPRSGYLAILYGTGQKGAGKMFERTEQIHLGRRPRSVFLRDFDGDDVPDLAVVRLDADDLLLLKGRRVK